MVTRTGSTVEYYRYMFVYLLAIMLCFHYRPLYACINMVIDALKSICCTNIIICKVSLCFTAFRELPMQVTCTNMCIVLQLLSTSVSYSTIVMFIYNTVLYTKQRVRYAALNPEWKIKHGFYLVNYLYFCFLISKRKYIIAIQNIWLLKSSVNVK